MIIGLLEKQILTDDSESKSESVCEYDDSEGSVMEPIAQMKLRWSSS